MAATMWYAQHKAASHSLVTSLNPILFLFRKQQPRMFHVNKKLLALQQICRNSPCCPATLRVLIHLFIPTYQRKYGVGIEYVIHSTAPERIEAIQVTHIIGNHASTVATSVQLHDRYIKLTHAKQSQLSEWQLQFQRGDNLLHFQTVILCSICLTTSKGQTHFMLQAFPDGYQTSGTLCVQPGA